MVRKYCLYFIIMGMLALICPTMSWAAEKDIKASPAATTTAAKPAVTKPAITKPVTPQPVETRQQSYLIGPGDVLEISVWKDEALTRQPVVRPDGFISFPLVGDVYVEGKTTAQVREEMEKKLVGYVPDVILSLDIKQINSMLVFVIGRVNQPGRFNTNSNVNVLQALATAGGLNVFAKRGGIKIFREENGKTKIFPFDYDDVIDGKRLEQNIRLKRGDIVVIP